MSYQPKVYKKAGGDELVVASGGSIDIESGGALKIGGVQVSASAAEINETILSLDIADGSADADYFLVSPHAGAISKIYSVIDGPVGTADITITASIGTTSVTGGVVTIATANSAAGDVDVATPSAANVVTAGQAIKLAVAGGGAGGSPRIHVAVVISR
ncbi:MAG: hypothetical protein WBK32_06330 [Candidatus Saccharicenans sp.]